MNADRNIPASVSLPLLTGLSRRPGLSASVVERAVERHWAARTICRWYIRVQTHTRRVDIRSTDDPITEAPAAAAASVWNECRNDSKRQRTKSPPTATAADSSSPSTDLANHTYVSPTIRKTSEVIEREEDGATTTTTIRMEDHHHWVLRSLVSPSLRVRRAAANMLLEGSTTSAASSRRRPRSSGSGPTNELLRDALHALMEEHLFSPPHATTCPTTTLLWEPATTSSSSSRSLGQLRPSSSSSSSSPSTTASRSPETGVAATDTAQLFALLTHLVCDQYVDPSDQEDEHEHDDSTAAAAVVPTTMEHTEKLFAMESFVAAGGLRWAARSMARLVSSLLAHSSHNNNKTTRQQDTSSLETTQERIILLVDLCYRLVLYASIPTTKKKASKQLHSSTGDDKSNKPTSSTSTSIHSNHNKKRKRSMSGEDSTATGTSTSGDSKAAAAARRGRLRDARIGTLHRVHTLLWTSHIPALWVSAHNSTPTSDRDNNRNNSTPDTTAATASAPLSTLACLILAYQVLKAQATNDDQMGLGLVTNHRIKPTDKSLILLGRLVDPAAVVSVVGGKEPDTSTNQKESSKKKEATSLKEALRASAGGGEEGSNWARRRDERWEKRSSSLANQNNHRESMDSREEPRAEPSSRPLSSFLFGSSSLSNNRDSTSAAAMARNVSAAMGALACQNGRSDDEEDEELGEDHDEDDDSDDLEDEDEDDEEEEDDENDEEVDEEEDEEIVSDEDEEGITGTEVMHVDDTDEDAGQFDDAIILMDGSEPMSQGSIPAMDTAPDVVAADAPPNMNTLTIEDRKQAYIRAGMELLEAQHPHVHHTHYSGSVTAVASLDSRHTPGVRRIGHAPIYPPIMTPTVEQSLLQSLCNIIKPPRKPLNLKIFLRRAPTQEEFFRGSLSRNPIPLSSLSASGGGGSGTPGTPGATTSGGSDNKEPRVRDLRQHIANDLQMADSAELLELLVANKILDMNLNLRVVQQVLWKKYVMENSTSASSASSLLGGGDSGRQIISGGAGSGLSMVFSTGFARGGTEHMDADTLLAALPPMVVTYRLAGVDGEATEDILEESELVDPEAPETGGDGTGEEKMEKEYGMTRMIAGARGLSVLIRSIETYLNETLRAIRRDDVGLRRGKKVRNPSRAQFLKSPACSGLVLLRHCARLASNRKKLVKARAPTSLLRMLLDVLNAIDETSVDDTSSDGRKRSNTLVSLSDALADGNGSVVAAASEEMDQGEPEQRTSRPSSVAIGNNPTADALQELIEVLASEISAQASAVMKHQSEKARRPRALSMDIMSVDPYSNNDSEDEQVGSTLPLLLSSLRTTSLSPPLRKVIAKLLPFLTYGQIAQSRELASNFSLYIDVDSLMDEDKTNTSEDPSSVLMETFIQCTINLPPVSVCNTLRMELISQGFVEHIRDFALRHVPDAPPSWSPSLWPKTSTSGTKSKGKKAADEKKARDEEWRQYLERPGVRTAFRMLIGLCANHSPTQSLLGDVENMANKLSMSHDDEMEDSKRIALLKACHWLESTSDFSSSEISMNGLGLLAETLLDALAEDNDVVGGKIKELRKKTRDRKREIAEERRSRALVGMSSFGPLVGAATKATGSEHAVAAGREGGELWVASENRDNVGGGSTNNSGPTSAIATMLGLFARQRLAVANSSGDSPSDSSPGRRQGAKATDKPKEDAKPSWMTEMEEMEDEAGLTCAVCQEGCTLQPSELLGLYAYSKKVSIPYNRGGVRGQIDGTELLLSLPSSLPDSLIGTRVDDVWFQLAKDASSALKDSGSSTVTSLSVGAISSRPFCYLTTVTAGNAIHCTCHARARSADRNHPKAPKSEWEGASLRNSRVTCNVILPLVSAKSSKVPLMAVESALADHESVVTNIMGSRPKSMFWAVMHDIRLLLLRLSYGEALNVDCGGGSMSSNASLLFYQMFVAHTFAKDVAQDAPETALHAKALSGAFLAAHEILKSKDSNRNNGGTTPALRRGIADAAPMASLCCILFHNTKADEEGSDSDEEPVSPSPKRRWKLNKDEFLCGLIRCAGRRFKLGVRDSGCVSSRGSLKRPTVRTSSFAEWDEDEHVSTHGGPWDKSSNSNNNRKSTSSHLGKRSAPKMEDYASALRPMIILYAIFETLSQEFVLTMDDEVVAESAARLVSSIECCQKAGTIQDLLKEAKITMDHNKILEEIEVGIDSN